MKRRDGRGGREGKNEFGRGRKEREGMKRGG